MSSHGIAHCYSGQTNNFYTMLLINTTEERFNESHILKEEIVNTSVSKSPHRLMKGIGLFS